MPVMKHFWFPCPGLLGLHPTASVSPQPGVSKSPEHELRGSGSVALVEMKSCCWAVSLGALVPKLLAQSFLVAHMDFVVFLKLWPQGDPAPFLVPLPLPVHSRVVITSLLLYCFAFPNMMVLREHSCSSDVPLFLLHAECQFVASVEVYPLFSPTEVQPWLVLCVNHTLSHKI